ncbi:polysaccharide biosynthesis/export family protein [Sphingomicrobium clamense]|uniref:Polysaccharide export protein n=1 Tax=Sphingomicrobium clamense TaxID=2851013 RepID=A0ABS6V3A2_9SPHN|nr:polysaccharide biosynthesis/export family protein [Sphingomicrobium sp. B8]MBW0143966.1 polysaccharide export protein [Sphingomicrobium sp. B8]
MKILSSLFMACALVAASFASAPASAQDSGLPLFGFERPQQETTPTAPTEVPTTQDEPVIVPVEAPQAADYAANEASRVFGSQLFTGAFAREAAADFNADYAINVGDTVNVRLWGGYNYESALTVDAQGNIFLPNVGPIRLLGVRNADLQPVVEQAVSGTFRSNVQVYAALAEAQPVRVFVGGFVNRPGAYAGTSMDSVLHYLDQAGGVDPERGSFLEIEIKRGGMTRARINLYDFLLYGNLPQVQLGNGDVIFVAPRNSMVDVTGMAENPNIFEFIGPEISLSQIAEYARPKPGATHVRVTRNTGTIRNVDYYPLGEAPAIALGNGDQVAFTADKRPGTITVRVEGEHDSPQEFVLPYGSRMGDVLSLIQYTERSAYWNVQLFRVSVKERQAEALETSLLALEKAALTGRSGTAEEARLRAEEAELLLQFVERAREVEPKGRVLIAKSDARDDLLLENGDIIYIPARDGLVLVNGEVMFPNAIAYNDSYDVDDYVRQAGGYTNKASARRVIIAHQDGSFTIAEGKAKRARYINAGDEIMVMPEVDSKGRQIFKELTQILYQVAVSAGVVLGL